MRAFRALRVSLIPVGLVMLVGCRPVLVNVPEAGHGQLGTGVSHMPELSDDGTVVAFETADYLTAEDHQGVADVYVRDLRLRDTQLMSVSPDGRQDGCGTLNPEMSGDGRHVAFATCSGIPGVPPPPGTIGTGVYVRDRVTGGLDHIGIPQDAQMQGGGFGLLDHDGSHIVILCFPPPSEEIPVSVCVQDRSTQETTVVARRTDGQIVRAFVIPTSITDDGRLVTFVAPFADVVPGSTDTRRQLFIRDVAAGRTIPVTVDPSVLSGDVEGRLSGDGSAAVLWQTAPPYHIVHKDLVTGAVHRVDQANCAADAASPTYTWASISDDGDIVAFQSGSSGLVPRDTNGLEDVFVWRTAAPCALQRVSVGPGRREGDGASYWPKVSGDGSSVAFVSEATNLVPSDTNGATPDAFVVRIGRPGR